MGDVAQRIEAEALGLSKSERSRIVVSLLDSLDAGATGDSEQNLRLWVQEAAARYQAHLRGEDPATPAAEVFAEMRAGQD